jgi:hypothetical protein
MINRAMVMATRRQHRAKSSVKIWKQTEFSKTEEYSVRGQNQDNRLNETRMFCNHSQLDGMRKPEREMLGCGVSLTANDHRQGRAGSEQHEGLEGLL